MCACFVCAKECAWHVSLCEFTRSGMRTQCVAGESVRMRVWECVSLYASASLGVCVCQRESVSQ